MMPSCPVCTGPGMHLGDMGRRQHWRCRNCGMDWSTQADAGRPPYCTRPQVTCEECSLVNYGRDCRNYPITDVVEW